MRPERVFAWLIRLGGLVGAMYVVFHDRLDRPALLALLAAMMGLADHIGRRGNGE